MHALDVSAPGEIVDTPCQYSLRGRVCGTMHHRPLSEVTQQVGGLEMLCAFVRNLCTMQAPQ